MGRRRGGSGSGGLIGLIGLGVLGLAALPREIWITLAFLAGLAGAIVLLSRLMRSSTANRPGSGTAPEAGLPVANSAVAGSRRVPLAQDRYAPSPATAPSGADDAKWIERHQVVELAGVRIEGGFLYVGSRLRAPNGTIDPALIDARLPVAEHGDFRSRQFGYWPSYDAITPEARRAYLNWLAGGRNAADADIGYVFLYFYALERRVLIDSARSTDARAEFPAIAAELRRLLAIYRGNWSFQRYAEGLLSWVQTADSAGGFDPAMLEGLKSRDAVPLPLKVALAKAAKTGVPLPAALALAWLQHAPEVYFRTAAHRCPEHFATLFTKHYHEMLGEGLVLPKNRTLLKFAYRPASGGFRGTGDAVMNFGDAPDPTVLTSWFNKLKPVVDAATSDLEPYSRFLGKNPDAPHAIEGLLQLPVSIWPEPSRASLETLQRRIGSGMITLTLQELLVSFAVRTAFSREKLLGLARALEDYRIAMEPDLLTGSRIPKPDDTIVLFFAPAANPSTRATPSYLAALLTIQLASTVAVADGSFGVAEINLLRTQIQSWSHLDEGHRRRLLAHLRLLTVKPASLPSLRKKLESLDPQARTVIAAFMATVAQADGVVDPAELRMLDRIYKALGIETTEVLAEIKELDAIPAAEEHGSTSAMPARSRPQGARGLDPVRIEAKRQETEAYFASLRAPAAPADATPAFKASEVSSVPSQSPSAVPAFKLDLKRIAELQRDSDEVARLLSSIFVEEGDVVESKQLDPAEDVEALSDSEAFLGLDGPHSAFVRALLSRSQWTRHELLDMSVDLDLMLDGALERINDAAFDRLDMPLVEGDDPVSVNVEAFDKLHA